MENRDLLKGRRQGYGKEVLGERIGTNSCSESFLEIPHMGILAVADNLFAQIHYRNKRCLPVRSL